MKKLLPRPKPVYDVKRISKHAIEHISWRTLCKPRVLKLEIESARLCGMARGTWRRTTPLLEKLKDRMPSVKQVVVATEEGFEGWSTDLPNPVDYEAFISDQPIHFNWPGAGYF